MEPEIRPLRVRRYFSQSQKELIIREHIEDGTPISQLARKNGIHPITVYQWKRNIMQYDESINPALGLILDGAFEFKNGRL